MRKLQRLFGWEMGAFPSDSRAIERKGRVKSQQNSSRFLISVADIILTVDTVAFAGQRLMDLIVSPPQIPVTDAQHGHTAKLHCKVTNSSIAGGWTKGSLPTSNFTIL